MLKLGCVRTIKNKKNNGKLKTPNHKRDTECVLSAASIYSKEYLCSGRKLVDTGRARTRQSAAQVGSEEPLKLFG